MGGGKFRADEQSGTDRQVDMWTGRKYSIFRKTGNQTDSDELPNG